MGGFKLVGPNYKFTKIIHPDLACLCVGFRKDISIELENYLKNKPNHCINKYEFLKIFPSSNTMIDHIGREANYYYSVTKH